MYNMNVGYGAAFMNALHSQIPALGRVFIVFASGDAGEERYNRALEVFKPWEGKVRVFTDLATAYAAITSNNNDVIALDGDGSHVVDGLAVSNNRVHFIGFDGGDHAIQQGAKVTSTDADANAYVWKDTGVRNSYRNIKFIQADTNAAALSVLQLGGEGTVMKNCSTVFGVVDNLDQTNAFEVVNGCDSGTFINCTFGSDTLLTSAARAVMSIDQVTTSQEFKSNHFERCRFLISSSSNTATFIRLAAVGDVLFTNTFEDCSFVASVDSAGGAAIAEAVQTGTGTVKGTLNFGYPRVYGVTNFTTATSGRNANVYVIGSVLTPEAKTDLVAVTPVAT